MGFGYAFKGIVTGFKEKSMKFHGVATMVVLGMGWCYRLSVNEWIVVLILIGLVWSAELINTSVEELNNTVKKELKLDYGATTDSRNLAAGSVLAIVIVAVIVGLMIFIPKIF